MHIYRFSNKLRKKVYNIRVQIKNEVDEFWRGNILSEIYVFMVHLKVIIKHNFYIFKNDQHIQNSSTQSYLYNNLIPLGFCKNK